MRYHSVSRLETFNPFPYSFHGSGHFVTEYSSRPISSMDLLQVRSAYSGCSEPDEYVAVAEDWWGYVFEDYSARLLEETGQHDRSRVGWPNLTGKKLLDPH